MDQIVARISKNSYVKLLVSQGTTVLEKRKNLYAAFMDLEKAYDRFDWLALWEVLRIYGVGGKLLTAIKSFYEAASACVKTNGETS